MGLTPKEHRKRVGLSQEDLARRAGVVVSTVRNLEQGTHTPTLRTAAAIARVLGISVDELMRQSEATTPA